MFPQKLIDMSCWANRKCAHHHTAAAGLDEVPGAAERQDRLFRIPIFEKPVRWILCVLKSQVSGRFVLQWSAQLCIRFLGEPVLTTYASLLKRDLANCHAQWHMFTCKIVLLMVSWSFSLAPCASSGALKHHRAYMEFASRIRLTLARRLGMSLSYAERERP
eukprot:6459338-Amphidinium_carterae.1